MERGGVQIKTPLNPQTRWGRRPHPTPPYYRFACLFVISHLIYRLFLKVGLCNKASLGQRRCYPKLFNREGSRVFDPTYTWGCKGGKFKTGIIRLWDTSAPMD